MGETLKQTCELDTSLPKGFKMTERGPLPEDWEVVRFESLVTELLSGDWGKGDGSSGREACFVLRGTDFECASRNELTNVPIRYLKPSSLKKRRLRVGDLLVELSGGSKDQPTGRVLLITESLLREAQLPLVFSNFVKRIRLADHCDPEYVWRYWQFLYSRGVTRFYEKRTTGIRNFKVMEFLTNEFLSLPPLPEQRAIARVLRTVQRAKEATERVIQATRELKKSLMRHLFTYGLVPVEEAERVPLKETEIGLVPEHWEVVKLGEVCQKPQYGFTASAVEYRVGPKFLRITDIQNDQVNWHTVPYCEINDTLLNKYRLEPGDVLFARIGATTGKTFLVSECPEAIFASYLIRVRVNTSRIIPEYLFYFTHGNVYWSQINAVKGGRLKQGINIPLLSSLIIPLPPLSEQHEIARILGTVNKKIQAEELRKQALDVLFKTLLHNLMTGKLRVKDLILPETGEGI